MSAPDYTEYYKEKYKQQVFDQFVSLTLDTISSIDFLKKLEIHISKPLDDDGIIWPIKVNVKVKKTRASNTRPPPLPQPKTRQDLVFQVVNNIAKPGIYPISMGAAPGNPGSSVHYVAVRKANPSNALEMDIQPDQLVMANGYSDNLVDDILYDLENLVLHIKEGKVESPKDFEGLTKYLSELKANKNRFIGLGIQEDGSHGMCQMAALMFFRDEYESLVPARSLQDDFKENEIAGFHYLNYLIGEYPYVNIKWTLEELLSDYFKNIPNAPQLFDEIGLKPIIETKTKSRYVLSDIINMILHENNTELFRRWSFNQDVHPPSRGLAPRSPIGAAAARRPRSPIDAEQAARNVRARTMRRQSVRRAEDGGRGVYHSSRADIETQLIDGINNSNCIIL